jgi:hypothetical protein
LNKGVSSGEANPDHPPEDGTAENAINSQTANFRHKHLFLAGQVDCVI